MTLKELEKKIHEVDDKAVAHLHAIIYAKDYGYPEYLDTDEVCLSGLIIWANTPQGYDYWSNISSQLKEGGYYS